MAAVKPFLNVIVTDKAEYIDCNSEFVAMALSLAGESTVQSLRAKFQTVTTTSNNWFFAKEYVKLVDRFLRVDEFVTTAEYLKHLNEQERSEKMYLKSYQTRSVEIERVNFAAEIARFILALKEDPYLPQMGATAGFFDALKEIGYDKLKKNACGKRYCLQVVSVTPTYGCRFYHLILDFTPIPIHAWAPLISRVPDGFDMEYTTAVGHTNATAFAAFDPIAKY